MDDAKLQQLRQTMPWRYANVPGTGTLIVFDRNNQEVPLMDLLEFAQFITPRMAL